MVNADASATDTNVQDLAGMALEPTDEVVENGDQEVHGRDIAVLRTLVPLDAAQARLLIVVSGVLGAFQVRQEEGQEESSSSTKSRWRNRCRQQ